VGSVPGRAANRILLRIEAAATLHQDYFGRMAGPVHATTKRFELQWRVPRVVYERLREELVKEPYFIETTTDAAGFQCCSTDQKMCAALLQLVEGTSSEAVWNYLKIGTSTANEALKQFSRSVVKHFQAEYLRKPKAVELRRISSEYEALGFPGCIGCLDCAGWEWESCPVGWQGNYVSAGKKPALRMEAVCDDYPYCWHLGFRIPGSKNDLNILYASNLFRSIRQGLWPPSRPQTTIAGFSLSWFYYPTDGVYPDWRVFIKTYKHPKNRKKKNFGKQQEAVRKASERLFGVLFRKYRMLRNPCSLWYTDDMANIMEVGVIMHNMTVLERKANYTGTRKARVATDAAETERAGATTYHALEPPTDYYQRVNWLHEVAGQVESREHHAQLQNALVEHMYSRAGDDIVGESSGDEFESQ